MTAPQTPQPLPEPGHVMSKAAWKRMTRQHYEQLAGEAEQSSTKEKS